MSSIVDLARRPRVFFRRATERPSLFAPVLIAGALGATAVAKLLALLGTLGGVAGGFEGNQLVYALGRANVSAPQDLVLASFLVLVMFVLGWALAAVLIYVAARYFEPDGSFRALLVCVGWGQLPVLVPALLSTVYVFVVAAGAPDLTTEAAASEWVESTFVNTPFQLLTGVLDPLFAAWVAYLWYLAAEQALGLSRRQALVCVAIPAGAQILNAVGGVFTVTG